MKKIIMLLALACISSCSPKKIQPMKLHFKLNSIITDPHLMEDIYSMTVCNQIHSSLLQYLSDGTLAPDIASEWKISDDQLHYNFKIISAQFSDQTELSAFDVEKSLKRIFVHGASISADLLTIAGYKEFQSSKDPSKLGIKAISKNEIEIILTKPSPILLKQLATPDTAILKLNDKLDIIDREVSSGPYHIEKSLDSKHLNLKFWRTNNNSSKNPAKNISILLNKETTPYDEALKNNSDFVNISSTQLEEIDKLNSLGFKIALGGITHEHFLIFNPEKISSHWRNYFFKNFHTDEFVKELPFSNKEPAYGFVPSVLKGAISKPMFSEDELTFDESKLVPFTLVINMAKSISNESLVKYILRKWNHPKLKIDLRYVDTDKYLLLLKDKKFDTLVSNKGLDYPDAMANLSYFKSDIRDNFFLVHDHEIDSLIEKCATSVSKDSSCFFDIQNKIMRKKNVLPLFFGTDKVEYWSNNIKLVPSHPLGLQFLKFDQIEMND